jgi:hypothetical protein
MKERLLSIAYKEHEGSPFLTQREFDCLVCLIEDGTISNLKELQEYGFGESEEAGIGE